MILYWIACILFILLPVFIARTLAQPDKLFFELIPDVWSDYGLILTAMAFMFPLAAYDMLKVSHRFAGPMVRIRRELKRLAKGEDIEKLSFREGDFLREISDSINQLATRLENQRRCVRQAQPETASESFNDQEHFAAPLANNR